MKKAGFLSWLLASTLALSLGGAFLFGCSSRLPSPRECEHMAARLVGGEVEESAAKMRAARVITHGCLTTPFDHQALRCVEATRNFPRCLEELSWRAPERKAAIARMLEGALAESPTH